MTSLSAFLIVMLAIGALIWALGVALLLIGVRLNRFTVTRHEVWLALTWPVGFFR